MAENQKRLHDLAVGYIEAGNLEEALAKHASAVLAAMDHLSAEVKSIAAGQSRLVEEQKEFKKFCLTHHLVPFGPFVARYHERIAQKKSIATFVTRRFFLNQGTPRRCFLQASSLALHLTEAIDSDPNVPHRTLIHTNSAVAHLPILSTDSHGRVSIWTVCAESFDSNCGGWNIPNGTTGKTADNVKELFTRNNDRLTTAFLMPLYVTPKDGCLYENPDAARFADLLSLADEVIILATGNRVVAGRDALPDKTMLFDAFAHCLPRNPAKFSLVVSSAPGGRPPLADEFRETFGTIYWESDSGWEFPTCHPTASSIQWEAVPRIE